MESVQKFLSKRSESADAGDITKLVKRNTEALFGRINAEYIIEHANLSVSLVSVESPTEVVGHMSFTDKPPSLPFDWSSWLQKEYGFLQATPVNTLFLRLFVAKDNFHQGASSEIFRTVFMTAPLLQYLFLAVPRDSNIGPALSAHFTAVQCLSDTPTVDLFVTHRHAHFPMLSIREALVEDTDDLMPVLLRHSPHITSLYGEYFLAELIASQDDHHRTLVAEVNEHAVGLMSVSTEVDVGLLASSYLLEPYHYLRREHPEDEVLSVITGKGALHTSTAHTSTPHASIAHTSTPHASTAHTSTPHASNAHTSTPHASTAHTSTPHGSTAQTSMPHASIAHTSTPPHTSTAHTSTPHASTAHTSTPHASTAHTSVSHTSTQSSAYSSVSSVCDPGAKESSKVDEKRWAYRLRGEPTALAVQLFAIDDRYEMRSVDFLPAVFKLFPEHDFLVLTQPHTTGDFPLLAHFTHVPPRPGTSLPQELYVTHKCSLLHSFEVDVAREEDVAGVKALVSQLSASESMVDDVSLFLRGKRDPHTLTPITALVARCGGQLVGLAVLRGKEDLEYIRSHYNIEDFVYFSYYRPTEHAQLHHLILNPIFSPYAKHFIKEVLRLSGSSCLYYHHSPSPQSTPLSLITALHCLVPIRPRPQVVYPESLGQNSPLPEILQVKAPFALYHTNRKLTFEPKISINCRVLIVGASQTALSLIESLVFCPHLHFSNITLVSPHGLSSPPLLALDTWVNAVHGKITAINRSEQCVEVMSGGSVSTVHYDWLVFTCGLQYSPPVLNGIPPPTQVITSVQLASQCPGPFVVFGSGLDAYSAVNQLLSNGVASDLVTLVQSSPPQWADSVIAERVGMALSSTGVRLLPDSSLSEWVVEEEGLVAVGISSTGPAHSLPCKTLIYLDDKAVDGSAFKALNDACLVFDSRLVVDVDHSTNDPQILAAGPLTKFSRKYRVGNCSHADFNSEEVGNKLALTLLSKLDPTFDPDAATEEGCVLIPQYTQPNVLSGSLPGGLHYLQILAPPMPGAPSESDKGRELVTDTDIGYFKIHISQYGRLDRLSMLSSFPLRDKDNYVCLYNVHEKYLNNLTKRFDEHLIPDLYRYFREPWACVLFHDRFPDFTAEVREYLSLLPHKADSNTSIEEMVHELVYEDPDSPLTSSTRATLNSQFNSSPAKTLIVERLFKFLDYNKQQLPMYIKPDPV